MRVAISGSREGFKDQQRRMFIDMASNHRMTEFHYGDCVGVDIEALWLLVELGAGGVLHSHPATMNPEWDAKYRGYTATKYPELGIIEHEAKHPLERNKDMVDAVDSLWAFPQKDNGEGGTWYTINYARKVLRPNVVIL